MSKIRPLPVVESQVQTREVLIEKISKHYSIRHYSSFRLKFPGQEKNQLMAEQGFEKVVLNIASPGYRNIQTRQIVETVLNHFGIKSANTVVVNVGEPYYTNNGPRRSIQVFYK
jgi:hypothetical protein